MLIWTYLYDSYVLLQQNNLAYSMLIFRPQVLSMYITSNSIPLHRIIFDVLPFDELQFDVKSSPFEQLKNTSNKIRGIVFSVIDVFYEMLQQAI